MGKVILGLECEDGKVRGRFEYKNATDIDISIVLTALELQKKKLLELAEKMSAETERNL